MVRGGAEVDQELRPFGDQIARGVNPIEGAGEIFGCPEVLADGHPDLFPSKVDRDGRCAGLEVPGLVKDVVSGEQSLVDQDRFPALHQKSGGVVEGLALAGEIPVDEADKQRNRADLCVEFPEDFQIPLHKVTGKDQIQGRVAG